MSGSHILYLVIGIAIGWLVIPLLLSMLGRKSGG